MNRLLIAALVSAGLLTPGIASAVPIALTKLTGLTGGSPAETAAYKADLSTAGIANLVSIAIQDNSAGLGGAPGQFSGFDLDAIKLSTTDCADAACAAAAAGLAVFNFATGMVFSPGAQRAPADPKLFGTGPTGSTIDDLVATLGSFDGDSSTLLPDGFVSMGDGGIAAFNLTAPTATSGLFLYIGEVGDNGEVAASNIEIRDTPVGVDAPATWSLLLIGLLAFARHHRPGIGGLR